jgi:hypothetical protein
VAVMTVELHDDGIQARTDVDLSLPLTNTEQDLVAFLQALANDWRGWPDARHWRSLDGKLHIDARHDGVGHVTLTGVLLGNAFSRDAWSARVAIELEAGEQMSQLVDQLRALFTGSP